MPPKKIKPNELCHCGSGNKYKKCCMITDAKEKSTLAAASAASAATTTTTTTVLDCYHGSDEEHFANDLFRNCYKTEKYTPSLQKTLKVFLFLGIESKYDYSPLSVDREKRSKYSCDIMTERGIINVLFRETNTFCHCMKPYKIEAIGMEKLGRCLGCHGEFQKMQLRRCSGCEIVHYCGTKCEKEDWPRHKKYCGILDNCNNNNNNNKH